MATIKAKQSGYWSSATTWSGGTIPGTGDILDLFGFAIRQRDNRQILKITNSSSVHESTFAIDGTVLATSVVLTFDNASGAGFGSTNVKRVGLQVKASAARRATIKSATANPANRWILPYNGSSAWHLHVDGIRNCDFKDFASGFLITQATPADPWVTISTCSFFGNGAQVQMFTPNQGRFVNCVFNNVTVDAAGAQGWHTFFSNASFTNGATFGDTASVTEGMLASRNHDNVAGDYRLWVSQGVYGRAVISAYQQADRPNATDRVRLVLGSADITFDAAAQSIANGLDMKSNTAVLRIPDGIELIVRGTFAQRECFIDLATTGRLINRASAAATFSLWCGSSVPKTSLIEDFGAANNVRIYQGRLIADEAISHGTMIVESPAILSVNQGITHTIGSGKTLRAMSSNAIQWNGTADSRITLQSSNPGVPWNLDIQRGRTLSSNGVSNYAIQPIQHPIASAMGGKTHFGFFNLIGMESLLVSATRPLIRWRIGTFDESTASWTFNNLDTGNDGEGDGHKFVSLIHNASAGLNAIYDAHEESFKQRRSTATNSASAWIDQSSIFADATYPNLARPPQSTVLYIVWRENGSKDVDFSKSVDGGLTWGAKTILVRSSGASTFSLSYPLSGLAASASQTLHVAGSWRASGSLPAGPGRDSNPWYMTSPDGGATWKNASGTTLTLPVSYAEAGSFRVFSGFDVSSFGVAVTSTGTPHCIYLRGGQSQTPMALWHAHWDGSQWIRTQISGTGQWVFGRTTGKIAIDAEDTIWIAWTYYTTQPDGTLASYAVTGDVYFTLSRSVDGGLNWTHQTVYKMIGPALVPQYISLFSDRTTSRTHLFWVGSPVGNATDSQGLRGVLWEEANALRPMRVTGVNVSDSSATGALVPPFASDSIDGGGNSGWIFRSRLPTPLIPTRVARKYRMYKREVV